MRRSRRARSPQARKAHRAGEVTTAGGLIGMLAPDRRVAESPAHDDGDPDGGLAFVPISVLGALVYIATDSDARTRHRGADSERRERRRADAWELTKQAEHAARRGDCTQVQAIEPRVAS